MANKAKRLTSLRPIPPAAPVINIAEAAIFLASGAAAAITGAVLPVDCGLLAANRLMASELTLEDF